MLLTVIEAGMASEYSCHKLGLPGNSREVQIHYTVSFLGPSTRVHFSGQWQLNLMATGRARRESESAMIQDRESDPAVSSRPRLVSYLLRSSHHRAFSRS